MALLGLLAVLDTMRTVAERYSSEQSTCRNLHSRTNSLRGVLINVSWYTSCHAHCESPDDGDRGGAAACDVGDSCSASTPCTTVARVVTAAGAADFVILKLSLAFVAAKVKYSLVLPYLI